MLILPKQLIFQQGEQSGAHPLQAMEERNQLAIKWEIKAYTGGGGDL